MKLSELIEYMNTIDALTIDEATNEYNNKLHSMFIDIDNNRNTPDLANEITDVANAAEELMKSAEVINNKLLILKNRIKQYRTQYEVEALRRSYELYEGWRGVRNNAEYIFYVYEHRDTESEQEARDYLKDRIARYTSWQQPGVLVRPLTGEMIDCISANDPLYLIDEDKRLLKPSRQLFTAEYQERLRYVTFNEATTPFISDSLPKNNIGLIFFNEFLNVRPLEIIKQYLTEIDILLKPGGVAVLTFNNGDIPQSTRNFEAGALCYTPASLLKPLVESYGFTILKHVDTAINISWLEIQKPGELITLRGGQCLRQIV